jgi:acetyltransferase-like isoleucine patch superfamily enzyme
MTFDFKGIKGYATRGSGLDWSGRLKQLGNNSVIEEGTRVFHPENVTIGSNVFVGHDGHIDGYHSGHITVGDGTWIGAFTFLNGAAGLAIGKAVGIGPRVTILTSEHRLDFPDIPVIHAEISFSKVTVEDGSDIGAGALILPGVTIGRGAVVGGGAVVTRDVPPFSVVAGNPARVIRDRR